jgi:hypothetical protein
LGYSVAKALSRTRAVGYAGAVSAESEVKVHTETNHIWTFSLC